MFPGSGAARFVSLACIALLISACTREIVGFEESIAEYRDRMLARAGTDEGADPAARLRPQRGDPARPLAMPAQAESGLPARESLMTQPAPTTQPSLAEVLAQVPDPTEADAIFQQRRDDLAGDETTRRDARIVKNYERVIAYAKEYLALIPRKRQVRLGLAECLQRALEHNYVIRGEAYNPAISRTQIVEAEAAFDAEFFLDAGDVHRDDPNLLDTPPFQTYERSYGGGFRQLLPTGMTVSTELRQQRNYTDYTQKVITWNPWYSSSFVNTLRQPLLRGFGLDVNRAQIELRTAQKDIAEQTFLQRVRDTLLQVESAYWTLSQARRNAMIVAESVGQNRVTYENLLARQHDVSPIELNNSLADWKQREVAYLEAVKAIRDAEDQLSNLLNDPDFKLSERLEIIPIETPFAAPLALDQFAEVRTAIDHRSEIREAKLRIDQTRINTLVAKNNTLPQLDVSFSYEVSGLGSSADNSFDNLTSNRYRSYAVAVTFSYAIGNRGPEAALRAARLRESQAIVALNKVTDDVVLEVNNAIRTLAVRYTQIPIQYDAVEAQEGRLRALQARTQKIDPIYLDNELRSVQAVASTRQTLLQVLIDYNIGVVELERAKGTLLEYNNVRLVDASARR
jgi:outer membrane protein TolC